MQVAPSPMPVSTPATAGCADRSLGAAAPADGHPTGLVVIPAYNEEACIGVVLDELSAYWPRERTLVVDDGSMDRTSDIARMRGVPWVRHATNLGYGPTLQTGFLYAERLGFDFVVLLDADGQHDPRFLPDMARTLIESGADLVVGSRFASGTSFRVSVIRRLAMRFFAGLTRACTGVRSTDTSSGFKAIRSRLFTELKRAHFADFHAELMVFLKVRGFAVAELPVVMRERKAGFSMYTWPKLLLYPARTLLGMAAGAVEALGRRARAEKERATPSDPHLRGATTRP